MWPSGGLALQQAGEVVTAQAPGLAERLGPVLISFLVLSIIFESALTPIFNWRWFLTHLDGKGWKTPITVGLAILVFWGYGLDIIRDLLVAMGYKAQLNFWGQVLTALLIAGGSDGFYRILVKLNIRMDPAERDKIAKDLAATAAAQKEVAKATSK